MRSGRWPGTSVYPPLQQCVQAGIAALANPPVPSSGDREFVAELASLGTWMRDVERLRDRTLFTSCTAYAYARSPARGAHKSDEVITAEINAAYAATAAQGRPP